MEFLRIFLLLALLMILSQCNSHGESKKDDLSQKKGKELSSEMSEITCPKCGHSEIETLPTEVCQLKYTCKSCKTELWPKEGDCCVFCSYGTHKCPSMQ